MSNNSGIRGANATAARRVALAFLLPLLGALLTGALAPLITDTSALSDQAGTSLIMSTVAVIAMLLGMRWYGTKGMGLRGGRPLTSGIGFASLAWIIFLILRFYFVDILGVGPGNATRSFIYLLLFEAFAVQIWAFGVFFHAVADWRGPLTAAISSGILFGLVAILLFQEAYAVSQIAIVYFFIWGILYGMIRLRSGSLLGIVIVQAIQSYTAWIVLTPFPQPDPAQLQSLYVTASFAYAVIIWRLWPKTEEDYRI